MRKTNNYTPIFSTGFVRRRPSYFSPHGLYVAGFFHGWHRYTGIIHGCDRVFTDVTELIVHRYLPISENEVSELLKHQNKFHNVASPCYPPTTGAAN